MARIAGVDIPRDKRVVISLTYIYGIGKKTAQDLLARAEVSEDTRVRDHICMGCQQPCPALAGNMTLVLLMAVMIMLGGAKPSSAG